MRKVTLVSIASDNIKHIAMPMTDDGLVAASTFAGQSELLQNYGASSKPDTAVQVPLLEKVLLAIGAGKHIDYREFAASATRFGKKKPALSIDITSATELEVQQAAEGCLLGLDTPSSYKTSEVSLQEIELVVDASLTGLDITAALNLASRICAAREIINTPANDLWPAKLAELVTAQSAGLPVTVEIWDEAKLEQEGCGGILGVGLGSDRGPRLIKISYNGGGQHLGLVGKGITFDTGGLSLKPAESMVGMKYDMAGAATVMAAVLAIAERNLAVTVTALLCVAENMPSGRAMRPGDVLKMRNGKTVEVLNTDAEGRLVMADGLSILTEMKVDHIVDVATLTGAATIALGTRYAGIMGHGAAPDLVSSAAATSSEAMWQMPLPAELRPLLDSDIADLTNVKIGNRAGGMLIAGWFLSEFVEKDSSWAHIDIAGPANNDGAPYGSTSKGASGVAIRTLVQLAENLAKN
ncbi:MAG: leucyl aminopeptidase [Aquiluna sp.]|nr:leucyl aminopeptidase [Aquiluna sp.]